MLTRLRVAKNNFLQSFALSPTKVKEHITFGHSLEKYICNLSPDNRAV